MSWTKRSVEDGLASLAHVPTFVGWGEKDFVFDGHFLAEWKRRLPQAEYHMFPEAGHYVLEDAREELVPMIRAFLER